MSDPPAPPGRSPSGEHSSAELPSVTDSANSLPEAVSSPDFEGHPTNDQHAQTRDTQAIIAKLGTISLSETSPVIEATAASSVQPEAVASSLASPSHTASEASQLLSDPTEAGDLSTTPSLPLDALQTEAQETSSHVFAAESSPLQHTAAHPQGHDNSHEEGSVGGAAAIASTSEGTDQAATEKEALLSSLSQSTDTADEPVLDAADHSATAEPRSSINADRLDPAHHLASESSASGSAPPPPPKGVAGADPAHVAAVAAAFGRGSPAQPSPRSSSIASMKEPVTSRSTTDTKGLPSTPSGHISAGSSSSPQITLAPSSGGLKIGKGPPPDSPPPAELQFDFNRFLEQMRYKAAAPIGEYVRSFIKGFSKKPYRISDQSKLIFDFLDFISGKMRACDVWAKASEAEFANAEEAMEKLIMNRLYVFTFAPAVQREGRWPVQTDDLERDRILSERISMFGWIREEHLDVPRGDHSRGFIEFAIQELLKINHYKAPRDKLICILNSCKVIFGLIRHLSSEENADTFIPVLIYVVLRSNPEHLISNVEYIGRFRTPERLSSESGYYLSSLMGAIAFIETMDYTSLSNITQEEFEQNVEAAVQTLEPSQPQGNSYQVLDSPVRGTKVSSDPTAAATSGEEAANAIPFTPMTSNLATDTRAFFQRTSEAARMGINTSLGKPIGALGRLLNEGLDGIRTPGSGDGSPARNDSPTPASSQGHGSVRGLFGFFDREDSNSAQQQSRTTGFNAASWSRGLKGSDPPDEDLSSPARGTFRQSPRVAASSQASPQSARQAGRPRPLRVDSVNLDSSDGAPASQVGTPSDDGSADGFDGTQGPTALSRQARGRLPNFGGDYIPDFLSDRTPARQTAPGAPAAPPQQPPAMLRRVQRDAPSSDGQEYERSSSPTPAGLMPSSDDMSAAELSAEVDRAHSMRLEAGVDTLQNIFPHAERDVCLMILESCNGDVQASIDKLLEMS